jgi:uncharacterized protein YlxP (DUF503 family)
MSEPASLFVAVASVELHFPGARSLKDKRQDLRSLIERLRHRFTVLVIESDHQDLHQRAGIGICAFATDAEATRATVSKAVDHILETFPGMVLDTQVAVEQVR